jgi:hypothetical protein
MIETVLAANGFPEAAEFIEQHHIKKELVGLADQARRSALEGRKGSAMTSRQTLRNESTQGREGNPYPVREASISGRSKRGARSLVSQ